MKGPTPFFLGVTVRLVRLLIPSSWGCSLPADSAQSHCVGGEVNKAVCARLIVGYNFLVLCVFLRKFSELLN